MSRWAGSCRMPQRAAACSHLRTRTAALLLPLRRCADERIPQTARRHAMWSVVRPECEGGGARLRPHVSPRRLLRHAGEGAHRGGAVGGRRRHRSRTARVRRDGRSLAELSRDGLARPIRPDDVAAGRREEALVVVKRARRHARELLVQHQPRPVVRVGTEELAANERTTRGRARSGHTAAAREARGAPRTTPTNHSRFRNRFRTSSSAKGMSGLT